MRRRSVDFRMVLLYTSTKIQLISCSDESMAHRRAQAKKTQQWAAPENMMIHLTTCSTVATGKVSKRRKSQLGNPSYTRGIKGTCRSAYMESAFIHGLRPPQRELVARKILAPESSNFCYYLLSCFLVVSGQYVFTAGSLHIQFTRHIQ